MAQRMIFRGNQTGRIYVFTMDVDPEYQYIEICQGGTSLGTMTKSVFVSNINYKLQRENRELVSINGQSIPFRLPTEKFESEWFC